ncbi:MAG: MBL fold metallo-hydrolase [Candidatus Omnitrophica bacterium]|nr:MBL fold metallo-hydrolase [Candidatus Omnitrophota bacterium]
MKKILGILFILLLFCSSVFSAKESEVRMLADNLHWLGHASFRLDGEKVIYFDPWKLSKSTAKPADIILVSHDHFDHFSVEDIKLISSDKTVIVSDLSVAQQLKKEKFPVKEIKSLSPGDSLEVEGVKIKAVPSYNTNKPFHSKESKKIGFILDITGGKIYYAGDTDVIPEMKDYTCDIALLPVSGTYVMTAEEAANAALVIKPKIAIPMHYGDIVGTISDAQRFKQLLGGKIEVRIITKEN